MNRPAFKYYGEKWRSAPWIISHFPDHQHYIELCGGAASVLIQKQPSRLETFNDIDPNVTNFFEMLRDHREELIRLIELTPWSRREYELHREPTDDPIEAARRFWIGCQMSINHLPYSSSGMSMSTKIIPRTPSCQSSRDQLYGIAERLIKVQIEQLPYDDIIERYDAEDNLYYFDPPYLEEGKVYNHSFTREDHIKAVELLNNVKSKVVVSGYNNPLYEELYEGWYREDKEFMINSAKKRTESIWMNYRHEVAKNKELF